MKLKFVAFFFFTVFLAGCTSFNDVPVEAEFMPTFASPADLDTPTETPIPPMVVADASQASTGSTTVFADDAAVILVGRGETLNLRAGAGIENEVIAQLAANETGIVRTGMTTLKDGQNWAEVRMSTGQTGWVNAYFLTEYVSAEAFCNDPKIKRLLDNFLLALQTQNGEMLAGLVSPVHGLDLRYFRYGNVANYTPEEARWVFESSYQMIWGNAAGSGEEVRGAFREIPLPRLLEVFGAEHQLLCNDLGQLQAFAQEPWLPEYENINFYQVFKPGSEQYGGLDWRAWLVGVEYVSGEPYLFALTSFESAP